MMPIKIGLSSTGRNCCMDKFKLPIGLVLVGIVLIAGGIFASGGNKSASKQYPKESLIENQKMVSVDVSGAVNEPGVYQLQGGSRIEEAIAAAGGLSGTANGEYVSKYLNMAQKLTDGTKIYVPYEGESRPTSEESGPTPEVNVVNINTASQTQLEALPGIGPVTASKIISDRPYQTIEDLLNKKIVSKTVFDRIKDQVKVY